MVHENLGTRNWSGRWTGDIGASPLDQSLARFVVLAILDARCQTEPRPLTGFRETPFKRACIAPDYRDGHAMERGGITQDE
jgi:hypothetical protein